MSMTFDLYLMEIAKYDCFTTGKKQKVQMYDI